MIAGAVLTHYLVPQTCDIRGCSRSLEDLARGKAYRRGLEKKEREEDV
jgi:hypothetical protein